MKKEQSQKYKSFSLAILLVLLAVVISLCSILVCGAQFHGVTQKFLKKHYEELNSKRFAQATDYISDSFAKVENLATMISSDSELVQIISAYTSAQDPIQTELLQSQLQETLAFVRRALPEIHAVSLCTNFNTLTSLSYVSAPSMCQDDLLPLFGWTKGTSNLFFPGDPLPESSSRFVEYHSQHVLYVFPLFRGDEVCATVIFTLYPTFLLDEDLSSNAVALLRSNGNLLYNTTNYTQDELSGFMKNPSGSAIPCMHFSEYDLCYFFQPAAPVLDRHISRLTTTYCIIGAILIVVATLLSDLMIRPILKPLHHLKEALEKMQLPFSVPRPYRLFSKRHIFIFLTIITLATTLLFSVLSYSYSRNTAFELLTASINTSFQQAGKRIENVLNNYEYISYYLAYSEKVQDHLLMLSNSEDVQSESSDAAVNDFLRTGTMLFDLPTNLQLYTPTGHQVYTTTNFPASSSETAIGNPGRKAEYSTVPFWSGSSMQIARKLINIKTMQTTGFLALHVDEFYVAKTFDFFPSSESTIYLHTADGSVLSSNDKTAIGKSLPVAGEKDQIFSQTFQDSGLVLTLRYDTAALHHEFNLSIRNLLYFLVFLLCLLFIINFGISHYLSIQFRRLAISLYNFSLDSDGEYAFGTSLVQEINQVYSAFNNMSNRIQSLVADILAAEASRHALELEKKQSDFLLLQSQINPHFLYNTFEAINGLIVSGKQDDAVITLNSLADMLRFSTKNNMLQIPVREEIEYIQRYINIMHLRYPDRLTLSVRVTEEAMKQETVKFILQPILENAIYHGFKPKGGQGHISVTGTVFDGQLLFVIRDDGIGMSAEKCRSLQEALDSDANSASIGLRNVSNRLRLLHGNAASLTINSTEGFGTVVTVIQPAIPPDSEFLQS